MQPPYQRTHFDPSHKGTLAYMAAARTARELDVGEGWVVARLLPHLSAPVIDQILAERDEHRNENEAMKRKIEYRVDLRVLALPEQHQRWGSFSVRRTRMGLQQSRIIGIRREWRVVSESEFQKQQVQNQALEKITGWYNRVEADKMMGVCMTYCGMMLHLVIVFSTTSLVKGRPLDISEVVEASTNWYGCIVVMLSTLILALHMSWQGSVNWYEHDRYFSSFYSAVFGMMSVGSIAKLSTGLALILALVSAAYISFIWPSLYMKLCHATKLRSFAHGTLDTPDILNTSAPKSDDDMRFLFGCENGKLSAGTGAEGSRTLAGRLLYRPWDCECSPARMLERLSVIFDLGPGQLAFPHWTVRLQIKGKQNTMLVFERRWAAALGETDDLMIELHSRGDKPDERAKAWELIEYLLSESLDGLAP